MSGLAHSFVGRPFRIEMNRTAPNAFPEEARHRAGQPFRADKNSVAQSATTEGARGKPSRVSPVVILVLRVAFPTVYLCED